MTSTNTSNAAKSADRSSMEIKDLLRRLHPDSSNHKDRIRRLNKFRNYVLPDAANNTPEYYDDDIPLLYLGPDTPAIYLDDPDLNLKSFYGLFHACGMQSDERGYLKRSARHATNLLAWLLHDVYTTNANANASSKTNNNNNNNNTQDNPFARSFLSLPVQHYRTLNLNLHVIGDDRGGAKEDACRIVLLILCQHLDTNGEVPAPVLLEEIVTNPQAQQAFDVWSAHNATIQQQESIKQSSIQRQAQLALQQRQDAVLRKSSVHEDDLLVDDHSDHHPNLEDHEDDPQNKLNDNNNNNDPDESQSHTEDDVDEFDVMAAIRKRQNKIKRQLKKQSELYNANASRWSDSQLARELLLRKQADETLQERRKSSQEEAQELAERELEKQKVLGKDPLSIDVDADMRHIEQGQAEQFELALHEAQEEIQKQESAGVEEAIQKAVYQKSSLESMLDGMGGLDTMENNTKYSVLPPHPKFDPLLFLTLVHRKTPYKDLVNSMDRLASKTENQAEQLQNLVRDNFPLFVRCAEGFEQFRTTSEAELGLGVNERIEKLEGIAESSAFQARKSFKPLLDNTSEVRKVQAALSVLERVAPLLQVPALMKQHMENRRYSQALKTFRRTLVIDDSCLSISLLRHVKQQAEDCVREARLDLEGRLTQEKASIDELLDGIRDLGELLELDVPTLVVDNNNNNKEGQNKSGEGAQGSSAANTMAIKPGGVFEMDGTTVRIREHPPALACLLLQAAHFSIATQKLIATAEDATRRIYESESNVKETKSSASRATNNQWKYDVLDARVLSTVQAVDSARVWLPRLVRVGKAAKEDEKRRAAKIGVRRSSVKGNHLTAFEVFVTNVAPSLTRLVEHAAFCSLGSNTRTGAKYIEMTYGENSDDKLRTLLRSPLPPSQSTKVGKELASLVQLLNECSSGVEELRPSVQALEQVSPIDTSLSLGDSALITIEKRRCIYAFDVCSRACSNRASGSGKFDADALLHCLQNLAEQLSRPEQCANEVEKGCELVIRRCCEGLASYVRDRGDDARLNAVAECADVLAERVDDVVREASFLTTNTDVIREVIMEDIMGLESAMFDEYLDSIRLHVANSVRVGWLDKDASETGEGDTNTPPSFPSYLSASLLAIVRCRAQVEQALGSRVRRSDEVPYQHLSMATVADGVVEGICEEVLKRKNKLKVRQADRLANELEFLNNSLKKFLGEETLSLLDSTVQIVGSKAGRGRDYQGDGPDGLAALEELERLGRVYVLCLGD